MVVLGQLSLICALLLVIAVTSEAASQTAGLLSSADIEQDVKSSLPTSKGERAVVLADVDLTRPFRTQMEWTYVVAILPGYHADGTDSNVKGGALAKCFVAGARPRCTYGTPQSSGDWLSTPIELESGPDIVYAGANKTHPLLMIQTGTAPGADGNYGVFTEIFSYDKLSDEFRTVFASLTDVYDETRFMNTGPLHGDVIADQVLGSHHFIDVYKADASGLYAPILYYQARTASGTIDSEMPEILRRLPVAR